MKSLDPRKRQAIRAALRIHDHLAGTSRLKGAIQLPTHEWDETGRLAERLEFVLRRGWKSASDSLLIDLEHALRRLRTQCDACHANLPRSLVTAHDQVSDDGKLAHRPQFNLARMVRQ
jgi:hypothetical protein